MIKVLFRCNKCGYHEGYICIGDQISEIQCSKCKTFEQIAPIIHNINLDYTNTDQDIIMAIVNHSSESHYTANFNGNELYIGEVRMDFSDDKCLVRIVPN